MSNSTTEHEVANHQDPNAQDLAPLGLDLVPWRKGIRESVVTQILGLDADRLVPTLGILAICFFVTQQANWIAYVGIVALVAVALGARLLAQKGSGPRASPPIESTKDPPQLGDLQIRARADGASQG